VGDEVQAASPLAAALAAAQTEIRDPERGRAGQVRGRSGYRYAGLDDLLQAVRPVLARHGLAVTSRIVRQAEGLALVTELIHPSGETLYSTWPLAWSGGPQDRGSELTYARRYTLEALVGVAATDDDDGSRLQRREDRRAPPEPTAEDVERRADHDPEWEERGRPAFCAELGRLGIEYDVVAAWCEAHQRPRPSQMPADRRQRLLVWLSEADHRAEVAEWAARGDS
jgi:hypothetical protein